MKAKDLRERSVEDLRELEKSLARDTFTHRLKNFTNRLDDTSAIGKAKKDVARVKTLLRQLELNAQTKSETPKAEAADAKPAKAAKTSKKTAKKKSE